VKIPKPWFLYLIECEDKSIYTGIAVDVAARYAAHLSGTGARYTRAHRPQKLLAVVEFTSRSAASQAEYLIKQMTALEKRAFAGRAIGQLPPRREKPLDRHPPSP